MSKRKRANSVSSSRGSRQEEDSMDSMEGSTSHGPTMRKRKKIFDPVEACHQLYDIIRNHKKPDGMLLCDSFIRAPKRRQEPLYYDVVTNPMDLLKIQQKLKTDEYNDIDDFQEDIELLVNNTKAFYKKTSQEYKDATELWDLFGINKRRLMSAEIEPTPPRRTPTPLKRVTTSHHRNSLPARMSSKGTPLRRPLNSNHSSTKVIKKKKLVRRSDSHTPNRHSKIKLVQNTPISLNFETTQEMYEDLFSAVYTAKDEYGKLLRTEFQLLPSKQEYPEYYEVVEQPIDLKKIAVKIQKGQYINLLGLERDLTLMCKNACLFNEPNSAIHNSAKTLKKIVQEKRAEIVDQNQPSKNKRSSLHNSSLNNSIKSGLTQKTKKGHVTAMANLVDENASSSESEPEEPVPVKVKEEKKAPVVPIKKEKEKEKEELVKHEEMNDKEREKMFEKCPDPDNPQWKLFESVKKVEENGKIISEPFWKLPPKRFYPNYYKEIKNPISLTHIRRKLLNKAYGTVSEVAGDLTIMFENAKKYNQPTSKLFRDTVKLQKLMQTKVKELLDIDQVTLMRNLTNGLTNKSARLKSNDIELPAPTNSSTPVKKRSGPKNISPLGQPLRGRPPKDFVPMQKRLRALSKYMLDYTCSNGRQPMLAFMEKPSKKLYAEYYELIDKPIDFLEIEAKIRSNQYSCEKDLVKDFQLMFSNCREFNEPNSPIYEDANRLEKHLMDRVGPLLNAPDPPKKERREGVPKIQRPRKPPLTPLEKSLKVLFDAVKDFKDPKNDRQLSQIFMKLPSRVEYPEYYEVIKHPIDIERIAHKMKNSFYESIDDLAADFSLMLDNACKFNEPDSQIYKDALLLQRVVYKTRLRIKEEFETDAAPDAKEAVQDILATLFTSVYHHQDDEGRCYSDSMAELPEHDEIDGKKVRALSLDLIKRRLDKCLYKRLDTFQNDFFACMERARRLSRADSQVFEDSIELQTYFILQRDELCKNGETLMSPALNYTLEDLGYSVDSIKHTKSLKECLDEDTETRSSFDSISKDTGGPEGGTNYENGKVPEGETKIENEENFENGNKTDDETKIEDKENKEIEKETKTEGDAEKPKSETLIEALEKEKLDIEEKQDEKTDSDTKIKENETKTEDKNELKTEGETKMENELKTEGETKTENAIKTEGETKTENGMKIEEGSTNGNTTDNTMTCGDTTYHVGEFVYIQAKEKGSEPYIVQIERLWEKDGKQMLWGLHYLRPDETFHVSSRKFLEKEVFKSDKKLGAPLAEVLGKCCVLSVKQYFTMKPENYEEKDIFVYESKYHTRNRCFKKLKVFSENKVYKLVQRDEPLVPKRVQSIFRDRLEKHLDELLELQQLENCIDLNAQNVIADVSLFLEDGNTYYEQYNTTYSGLIKTGDFVYVIAEGGRQVIAQVDSIWETADHKCYFRGPWFIQPNEVPTNGKNYYVNEMFMSTEEDVNPLVSIVGKCAVLDYNDYVSWRPTEIFEHDVFICTSLYDEINRQMKKLSPQGIRKYHHKPDVLEDEIYYFPRLLNPPKEQNGSVTLVKVEPKLEPEDVIMEDSMDAPSVGSTAESHNEVTVIANANMNMSHAVTPTPTPSKTKSTGKKTNKSKVVTGYILYSREMRKTVVQNNPDSTFGDISRIVGSEWKSLPTVEKQFWEEKASKLNEETKAQFLLDEAACPTPVVVAPPPPPDQIFECLWDNCDYQFEDLSDLIDHSVRDAKDQSAHVQSYFQQHEGAEMQCKWKNCSRIKKNLQPFPNIQRLLRHVRDMHINKGNGRSVPPENRNKNFMPSHRSMPVLQPAVTVTPKVTAEPVKAAGNIIITSIKTINPLGSNIVQATAASTSSTSATPSTSKSGQEPLFISVPPRPQRVLHSEAYIRYIEGLNSEQKHITNWERTLHVTQDSVPPPDPEKLASVATWLGKRADQHDNVVQALWDLRNQLVKDTLCLHKTL